MTEAVNGQWLLHRLVAFHVLRAKGERDRRTEPNSSLTSSTRRSDVDAKPESRRHYQVRMSDDQSRSRFSGDHRRVTNPGRFRPLHYIAWELLDHAARDFNVERIEQNGLDPELEVPVALVGPTVQLVPSDPASAPLVVAFSAFPGLHVRFGRWCRVAFPACGCDDCRETLEGESERLRFLAESLMAGRFREELQSSSAESGWYECEFWSPQAHQQQRYRLDRDDPRLRGLARSSGTVFRWKAWPRRGV